MLTKLSFFAYLSGIQSYVLAPLDKIQGSKDTGENSTSFAAGGDSDLINSSRQNWIALAPAASIDIKKKKFFFSFSHCVEISIPLISISTSGKLKWSCKRPPKFHSSPSVSQESIRHGKTCLVIACAKWKLPFHFFMMQRESASEREQVFL